MADDILWAAAGNLAKTNNTLIIPSNVSDVAGLVASAMSMLDKTRPPHVDAGR
jgi:hypothetical protein